MKPKPSQTHFSNFQLGNDKPAVKFYQVPDSGVLRISGAGQVDFLQRQTTNDMGLLTDLRPLVTVLTSPTARILDVLTLIKSINTESGEDELLALTLPGRAKDTAAYLKSKIFFMDNVIVADVSGAFGQTEVFGSGVAELFTSLGYQEPAGLPAIDHAAYYEGTLTLLRQEQVPPRLLMSKAQETSIVSDLQSHGARMLAADEFEIARVEAGRPGPLVELTADYTPLENNLNWAISGTKGCYTGQEVIARQITYDKITRKLVGIQLESEVAVGSKVWAEKQAAGSITSTALSGKYGPIALAMMKRPHFETGAQVIIGEQASGIPGTIIDLPFSKGKSG